MIKSKMEKQEFKGFSPKHAEQLAILMNQVTGDLEKIDDLLWYFLEWGEHTSFDFRYWMLDKDVCVYDFQALVYRLSPTARKLFEKCVPLGCKF